MTPLRIATLMSLALVIGCATEPMHTTSGRPEVTIRDKSLAQVRNVIVNHFVDLGWAPVSTEGNQLVFEHEGSVGESFAMGLLTDNPQSKNRVVITLVPNGSDVRVVGAVAALGQSNFGRQQAVELRGKGYQQLQAELEAIKNQADQ